jgi:Methyltransferase small domain
MKLIISNISNFFTTVKRFLVVKKGKILLNKLSPKFQVLNGPFKGMKYPNIDFGNSSLPSRIIGSYEMHLHPIIEKIINTYYTDIIDIGSSEGYFAVGLALQMPQTTVHCFDTSEKAMAFCKAMGQLNQTKNLTFDTWCAPETLIHFPFRGRTFILCDCEGYELTLFTQTVVDSLKNVDLLIELHDLFNPIISSEIKARFQQTHHIEIINNANNDYSSLQGLEPLSWLEKKIGIWEHRGGIGKHLIMEWAWLTAK